MSRECHGIVTCYLGITLGDLLLLRIVCVERMEAEDVAMFWRMLDFDGPTGWNGWRWRHEHAAPGRPAASQADPFIHPVASDAMAPTYRSGKNSLICLPVDSYVCQAFIWSTAITL